MSVPPRSEAAEPEHLLPRLQRQRHHRQHGDPRRQAASELTPDFEVIVVNDGSADAHRGDRRRARPHVSAGARRPPSDAIAATAAALQTGFRSATKELIFYTDGDAQYDPAELATLWASMTPDADLVNGYKISRSDPLHRIVIGRLYHHIVSTVVRPDGCATSTAISG